MSVRCPNSLRVRHLSTPWSGTQIALFYAGGAMSTATLKKVALLIVAVALPITSALARDGRHERRREGERHERMERRAEHRRWEQSRTREHWRHQRERWAAEHRRDEHRPNGWDHGRKTGWGNNDVPPGQAKKDYRNNSFHGTAHGSSDHGWSSSHNQPTGTTANPPTGTRDNRMARIFGQRSRK